MKSESPNQITGPNAGGPRQSPIPTPLAARVGQFCRWAVTRVMRLHAKSFALATAGLLLVGCLSAPRDFASPTCTIKTIDDHGAPLPGLSVTRHWDDRDANKTDTEFAQTDATGVARFPRVSAQVGLFTGAAKKTVGNVGPCAWGSGTSTSISVSYRGRVSLLPGTKQYRQVMPSVFADSEGVVVRLYTQDKTNTLVSLDFPKGQKEINYTLISTVPK